jgi:hypothetical protein
MDTPAAEIATRRDVRNIRIFTSQPFTAKDFDDGVNCTPHAVETIDCLVSVFNVSHYMFTQAVPLSLLTVCSECLTCCEVNCVFNSCVQLVLL